jgi:hypothetical protein
VLAALDANFLAEGATATEWMKVCGVPDSTFYSARKQLLLGEYVARVGKRYVLLAKALDVLGPQVSGLTPTPKALQNDSKRERVSPQLQSSNSPFKGVGGLEE